MGREPQGALKWLPVLRAISGLSKDRSTKISAIALGGGGEILSTGYNGFPRGVVESIDSRHERPEKYTWTSHAEENCIANAARSGARLEGCTLLLYGLPPCSACARMIVNAGIRHVQVFLESNFVARPVWLEDQPFSEAILAEGGVSVQISGPEGQSMGEILRPKGS